MSLETDLAARFKATAAITNLVGQRIYPNERPQNDSSPSITYRRISSDRSLNLGGADDMLPARIQFDAWSSTYKSVDDIIRALVNDLNGFYGTIGSTVVRGAKAVNEVDQFEGLNGIYHKIVDINFWYYE